MPTNLLPIGVSASGGGDDFFEGVHAKRAPLQNLFSPFRIRFLVLNNSSNAERGSGGEVEISLKDRTNPILQEPHTDSVL